MCLIHFSFVDTTIDNLSGLLASDMTTALLLTVVFPELAGEFGTLIDETIATQRRENSP